MIKKTGILSFDRPKVEYQSPKSNEEVEAWGRMMLGERERKAWLEKRLLRVSADFGVK